MRPLKAASATDKNYFQQVRCQAQQSCYAAGDHTTSLCSSSQLVSCVASRGPILPQPLPPTRSGDARIVTNAGHPPSIGWSVDQHGNTSGHMDASHGTLSVATGAALLLAALTDTLWVVPCRSALDVCRRERLCRTPVCPTELLSHTGDQHDVCVWPPMLQL